jgi:hypothetical protein
MKHPLGNYRAVADKNFIIHAESRFYNKYETLFAQGLGGGVLKEKQQVFVSFEDVSGEWQNEIITFSSYLISECHQLENEVHSSIEFICQAFTSDKQQEKFIERIIAELQLLQNGIKSIELSEKYKPYKDILLDKVSLFIKFQQDIHSPKTQHKSGNFKKLKWLRNINVLTTLFIDLMDMKVIEEPAEDKEVAHFICNNFTDEKGNAFDFDTIYTYVKESNKVKKRAKRNSIDVDQYLKP